MLIELSKDQEERLFELLRAKTLDEVEALCEPSGDDLRISVCGPFGADASGDLEQGSSLKHRMGLAGHHARRVLSRMPSKVVISNLDRKRS